MAHGLQVFSPNGSVRLDTTDRLTRLYGAYSLPIWDSGIRTISVPGIVQDGFWLVTCPFTEFTADVVAGGIRVRRDVPGFTRRQVVPVTLYRI